MTSHETLMCRALGIPAIGDASFKIDEMDKVAYALEKEINEGDVIYICASAESRWSLEGKIVPRFKAQVDSELFTYLSKVLHAYDDMKLFSQCEIEFQLHYAEIKEILHKLGVKYENINYASSDI